MQRVLSLLSTLLVFLSFFAGSSFAKETPSQIPDIDGVYDDPTHPGVKVRVFVHREKPSQPESPVLACGLSDPDSSSPVAPLPWKLTDGWSYRLNPSSVPASVGGTNLPTIASDAFSKWSAPSGVGFVRGADTTVSRQAYDGQNIIAWGRTSGSALAVTYTRYYSSSGQVVDVDTIMNKKYPWAWSGSNNCAYSNVYDAQNILTHELGHWLGLEDHYTSEYTDNTMFGYGSKSEVKKNTLTTGDEAGVKSIYN